MAGTLARLVGTTSLGHLFPPTTQTSPPPTQHTMANLNKFTGLFKNSCCLEISPLLTTCYNISQPLFPSIGTPSWSCLQVSEVTSQYTVKTRISEPCAMKSRISFSGTEAKNTAKTQSLSPFRGRKKNKIFLTLLREESPTT